MIFVIPAKAGIQMIEAKLADRNQARIANDKSLRVCLIMDAGSAGVPPATPEGRIGYSQTIMSVRRKPVEARIYRGSQTT